MKTLVVSITIAVLVFFTACGSGSGGLEVKYEGKTNSLTPSSTFTYHATKSFSRNANGEKERTTASKTTFYLANFELDTSKAMISLAKQKTSKPEDIKVVFAITGEAGSSGTKGPVKAGEYLPENKSFQTIENVDVFSFDGKDQKRTSFKFNDMKGKVVIESVSDDKISGSIDITDGTNTVKGGFTANAPKK